MREQTSAVLNWVLNEAVDFRGRGLLAPAAVAAHDNDKILVGFSIIQRL